MINRWPILALLALTLIPACKPAEPPVPPEPAMPAAAAAEPAPPAPAPAASEPSFTGKVWAGASSPDLPGTMRIFLADGTLVMDSCWETYRLAQWRRVSDHSLVIVEEGQEIPAEILEATEKDLRLRLTLVGGETKDEAYQPAPVPYVCPDMPK